MVRLMSIRLWSAVVVLVFPGCGTDELVMAGDNLSVGTWGGEDAAVQVEPATVHVHVGCTKGDFPAPVELDAQGRFSVPGAYVLRAFPIEIGPALPAQFAGVVQGTRLTMTIAVNDTVEKKLVVLGPVAVILGREPRMGPCPICTSEMADERRKVGEVRSPTSIARPVPLRLR
jgi:hypothetical protein